MGDSNGVHGQLVTSDGDAGPADATVELWNLDGPMNDIPEGVPASAMRRSKDDDTPAANAVLGSGRTNENGRFEITAAETPDGAFLRAFGEEGELLGTVTVENFDPEQPVMVPVTAPGSGIGWKRPAAGGAVLATIASAFAATQWLGDGDGGGEGGGGTDGGDVGPSGTQTDVGESQDDGGQDDDSQDGGDQDAGQDDGDQDDDSQDGDTQNDESDDQNDESDDNNQNDREESVDDSTDSTAPKIDSPDQSGSQVRTPGQQGKFLYADDDPIQEDVDEEALDELITTIVRGRVTGRDGDPLEGATVRIQDYPEFGRTQTRETGLFDMVVNGGRQYVIDVDGEGFLSLQRKREIPPRDTFWLGDVTLVEADDTVTTVETNADEPQTHRATESQDDDGRRQSTVYFPPGTAASTGNDGSGTPTELEVRATEYTVGENGPEAMPAELPPATGYTYAVELTAEPIGEDARHRQNGLTRPLLADAKGDVEFDDPVVLYLENFLDFPVGQSVPTGVLEREGASWEPIDDGRVIEVLEAGDGRAELDITGDGSRAYQYELEELGIGDDEQRGIAAQYDAGETLWRVPIEHFTPFDCNWPATPENDEGPGGRCQGGSSSGDSGEGDA